MRRHPYTQREAGRYTGFGVSPGIAIGQAVVVETRAGKIFRVPLSTSDVEHEAARFQEAVQSARNQLREVKERVLRELGAGLAGIFDAHLLILDDGTFTGETLEQIRRDRVNAEWALSQTVRRFLEAFSAISDPYLRDRGHDIEDVHNRLQTVLSGTQHRDLSELAEDSVVVAASISPSDTILLKHPHVVGFCTDLGGRTSHTAIIANALEIPAVVGMHNVTPRIQTGQTVIVDGEEGVVHVDPPPEVLDEYRRRHSAYLDQQAAYIEAKDRPAVTADGVRIALRANVELPEDMETAQRYGAEGVGLYRSEFLFLERSPALPSEEDHYEAYRRIAEQSQPGPAVIRTLDLGGEKYFHDVLDKGENNPVMGMRAIRFCLKRPDIFKAQLRGLLRASAHGPVKVMFPLISGVDELRRARRVLDECRTELSGEGVAMAEQLDVGIMIEVPSAAAIADLLAREVDFFSIGTNDLIQYCLALDRGNDQLGYLYDPLHPAVLRTLDFVVRSGQAAGIPVSLCGEMAAEARYLAVLVGLGLTELSMNPVSLPGVKKALLSIDSGRAREVVRQALDLASTQDIAALLESRLALPAPPRPRS